MRRGYICRLRVCGLTQERWLWRSVIAGILRPDEQRRLSANGFQVRVYTPYGVDWYGYFMRRLAERPANLRFFLRSLATKG